MGMRTTTVAGLAAALAALSLMAAPAPPVRAVAGGPPAPFGAVLVPAGSWLGGLGVTVYSNGSSRFFCDPGWRAGCRSRIGPRGVDVGVKWQCVELAQRLYVSRGWYPRKFAVALAYQIWWIAPRMGMTRTPNGAIRHRDVHPGDMIVWRPGAATGRTGHVAVVDFVSGTQVWVKEQNWGPATTAWNVQRGQTVYSLSSGLLSGHAWPPEEVYGVVHSPNDHLVNPPPDGPAWWGTTPWGAGPTGHRGYAI
jgi:hypothetical protein